MFVPDLGALQNTLCGGKRVAESESKMVLLFSFFHLSFCDFFLLCFSSGFILSAAYLLVLIAGAHGWGFTLAGKDDWKLDKFSYDAPTTNFKVDYGVDGKGMKSERRNKTNRRRPHIFINTL